MDAHAPDSWHDFFRASAGAAAALTGTLDSDANER
jgi:hypothetical protein